MQGKVTVLDRTGHTTVEYDTDVPESLEVAEEAFRRARQLGYMAVIDTPGKGKEMVKDFKPGQAEEFLMIPALQGG